MDISLILTTHQAEVLRSALADYATNCDLRSARASDENAAADLRLAAREADSLLRTLTLAEWRE